MTQDPHSRSSPPQSLRSLFPFPQVSSPERRTTFPQTSLSKTRPSLSLILRLPTLLRTSCLWSPHLLLTTVPLLPEHQVPIARLSVFSLSLITLLFSLRIPHNYQSFTFPCNHLTLSPTSHNIPSLSIKNKTPSLFHH